MTAGVQAAGGAAVAASFDYLVTVANNGNSPGVFGFFRVEGTNPGAIGPIGTLKGVTIEAVRSSSSSEDLLISLAGVRVQSFWRRVVVRTTAGTWRVYLSADAVYATAVNTTWQFGSGSSPVWSSTNSPREVLFFI